MTNRSQGASRPKLHLMSADEFQQLIASGGTMTIKQINTRLNGSYISAALIEKLGIEIRKERTAAHIATSEFHLLAVRFAAHILAQASAAVETA